MRKPLRGPREWLDDCESEPGGEHPAESDNDGERRDEDGERRDARCGRMCWLSMMLLAGGGGLSAYFITHPKSFASLRSVTSETLERQEAALRNMASEVFQEPGDTDNRELLTFNSSRASAHASPCASCTHGLVGQAGGCIFSKSLKSCVFEVEGGFLEYCRDPWRTFTGPVRSCNASGAQVLSTEEDRILNIVFPTTSTYTATKATASFTSSTGITSTSTTGTATATTTTTSETHTETSKTGTSMTTSTTVEPCDGCCPAERQNLTLVVTVFERDLCKLKVLANSLAIHDPNMTIGKVVLGWVSHLSPDEFKAGLDKIREVFSERREVEIFDIVIPDDAGGEQDGWLVQQAVKLKVASRVTTEYYLVLDSKNALMKDIEEDSFFTPCNQAKIFGRYDVDKMPETHADWFAAAAEDLGSRPLSWGKWPMSAAPMLLHTRSVLGMLRKMRSRKILKPHDLQDPDPCAGGLCQALSNKRTTELALYLVYVANDPMFNCIHAIEEIRWNNSISESIWHADDSEGQDIVAKQVKAMATQSGDNSDLLFFGVRPDSLDSWSSDRRYSVLQDLAEVYTRAGLYSFDTWDDLLACVEGEENPSRLLSAAPNGTGLAA